MQDIIERLMDLPGAPDLRFRQRAILLAREAAGEIARLRGAAVPGTRDRASGAVTDTRGQRWCPSPDEGAILDLLLRNSGSVVTRHRLLNHLYANDPDGGPLTADQVLSARIYTIRKRSPWPITTVRGGYILNGYRAA